MVEATTWERAYQRFETPDEEIRKFMKRLRLTGADRWQRSWSVLEICSGRGNGLEAWRRLGFSNVRGIDLSPALVFNNRRHDAIVGDARALPFENASHDVVIVQGGLHHLLTFDDVCVVLGEMRRVVRAGGRIVIIEPWRTPFLTFVHAVSEQPLVRRMSSKLDAFATMTDEERPTYEAWLGRPQQLVGAFTDRLLPLMLRRRWGKIVFVGTPA